MNGNIRKIGVNIFTLMRNAGLDPEDLVNKLNYSYRDICRIIEGKVMLPPSEIEKIANIFGKTTEELITYEIREYAPEFRYITKFSNPDNLNIILDLLDEYVELVEELK